MKVWAGIDQGERINEVALLDASGDVLERLRVHSDPDGVREVVALLRRYVSQLGRTIVVTEGSAGLFSEALRDAHIDLRMIHPVTSAQWRRQHRIAGDKSDRSDAALLAEFGRTQHGRTCRAPRNSDLGDRVKTLARAHEDSVKRRHQLDMQLRAHLLDYYPAAVTAFPTLHRPTALRTLDLLPTPRHARSVNATSLLQRLRDAGLHPSAADIERRVEILRAPALRRRPKSEAAAGEVTRATLAVLTATEQATAAVERLLVEAFATHPSAAVYMSFPGLGGPLGARILGEIGDDLHRFPSARDLCAFAGTAPVTRTSGKRTVTHRRLVCNRRLNRAAYQWTLPLIRNSAVAAEIYRLRRARGDRHGTASRNLTNHYLRALHHCLVHGEGYDEAIARRVWLAR